mmetsp:Transcript_73369/g.220414  ORF Transcript_73369/g.220414 Transcript_73369/m.220414 type:complete len:225 (+) Transcript_73369:396-1070(+)
MLSTISNLRSIFSLKLSRSTESPNADLRRCSGARACAGAPVPWAVDSPPHDGPASSSHSVGSAPSWRRAGAELTCRITNAPPPLVPPPLLTPPPAVPSCSSFSTTLATGARCTVIAPGTDRRSGNACEASASARPPQPDGAVVGRTPPPAAGVESDEEDGAAEAPRASGASAAHCIAIACGPVRAICARRVSGCAGWWSRSERYCHSESACGSSCHARAERLRE